MGERAPGEREREQASSIETLGGLFERAAGSAKGVRFLDREERARFYPYAQMYERAARAGSALRARGIAPADRVAIILPTSPDFYDAFFGALLAGAVPVPLYPPVRLGRLAEYHTGTASLLRGCGARMVLTDVRTARVVGRSVASAGPDLGIHTVARLRTNGRSHARRHVGIGSGTSFVAAPDADDVALVQHSSGTTGLPRPIRLTHRAVLENVRAIRTRILEAFPERAGHEHAAVSWLPLYHDMGLAGCLLTAMAQPVDLTLIPPEVFVSRPATWLRAISRYGATVSGAPNFAYALCADRIRDEELAGHDLSSWLVALNGAEPVTAGALRRFTSRFAGFGFRPSALTPVYGLAEATLAVTFSDPASPVREGSFDREALVRDGVARPAASDSVQLVSVGRPLPGVGLLIADESSIKKTMNARAVDEGVVGRVLVSGPSMMDGYEGSASGAPPHPREWLDTGDTGFLLDGELYLYGRTKDILVLRGCKYAPQQVEHALDGLAGVRKGCVAAVGLPSEEAGEEQLVVLLERARYERRSDDEALAENARRRIAAATALVPGEIFILEPGTLPRTSSGKIRRAEARRRFETGELSPPDSVSGLSLMREMVRSRLALARMDTKST
jgi:acyl-CoA synthetase (AMP-forming)/AMP-acid ligase II